MQNTVSPGSALEIGSLLAKKLMKDGADQDSVQEAIDKPDHPFWESVRNRFVVVREVAKEICLELVGTISAPPVGRFVAKEKFKDKEVVDGVRFSSGGFGENFKSQFLSGDGWIEENVVEAKLKVSRLLKRRNNQEILDEVGSATKVKLAHVFESLKLQGNGELPDGKKKLLKVDGSANLFPVEGTEWFVDADWCDGGWGLGAHYVSYSGRWGADCRVVSRDSEAVTV